MSSPPSRSMVLGALMLSLLASGCAAGVGPPTNSSRLVVVAVENTWGSIAAQLGGGRVAVTSIVSDPNADPHEYESTPADARLMASANYVIINGAGYDSWADQLLAAQPEPARKVLDVADLVGKRPGDNPHFWYNPAFVDTVVTRITADYASLQPAGAAYFAAQASAFQQLLAPYRQRLADIQRRFGGVPVAATESIFQYMAEYLHLDLVTPAAFMDAVSEGNDPSAASLVTFTRQIATRAFRLMVVNVQTVTPLTTGLSQQAIKLHIPVVGVSETMQPATATFEEWMDGQLDSLIDGLNAGATGR
ncbi:MAG TPA: zinc ABC transporter substrate-binding protein [Candidatus Saccharimonadales bacterium]|nr:zinc ABC transporter substrate-binding protein [Candidatus Saccharimonadales bacterium]